MSARRSPVSRRNGFDRLLGRMTGFAAIAAMVGVASAQMLPNGASGLLSATKKGDPFQPPASVTAVFGQYLDALNAGDLTRVRTLFADDFSMPQRWHGCAASLPAADCQIERLKRELVGVHAKLRLTATSGGRELIRAKLGVSGDGMQSAGAGGIWLTQELAISDGRIHSIVQTYHTEDAATGAYVRKLRLR